jgi:hypothetical protein
MMRKRVKMLSEVRDEGRIVDIFILVEASHQPVTE